MFVVETRKRKVPIHLQFACSPRTVRSGQKIKSSSYTLVSYFKRCSLQFLDCRRTEILPHTHNSFVSFDSAICKLTMLSKTDVKKKRFLG